ncbi:tRNA cyclic N6-threonylcarbamoyladenosine(37) synthase TcdA [Terasakiispira papahanaumokuakeensis]|uniref:tRNA threonylcarbamoyladenosine dehydratase n=1 Tax=Terasakiispira papahanaumokuakeensis TaxID=197479 RepID=A0A1E2VDJ6_9GAMM|nr:tRNA cyclic N6-threonylcarbamoyladenosine(37) synthase TcdA [Terasakiispira papahanaumokuakeensis]ODC05047.1 tRNA cyclic N6-threonylcarbamoyladenosine(37) synthase TcdA [Terasakiispira papahanaumokuakeensis]
MNSQPHPNEETLAHVPLSDDYRFRFGGIARLYGEEGLVKIAKSHVAVIGIGGVGSWTAEALARSGVGQLTLFDLDDVCVSNVNRQLHALEGTIGQPKVAVMAERLQRINPEIQVHQAIAFVTPQKLPEQLDQGFDVIIDATDTVPVKAALIAWCKRHKQRLVVVGGAGGQLDATAVKTADLARTTQDPLLAKVRNLLRREYGFSRNPKRRFDVECVYSEEQLTYPQPDGSTCAQKPGSGESMRMDCSSGFGAATFVTGTFGFVAAQRALAKITRSPKPQC